MKAFLIGCVAAIVLAVVAGFALEQMEMSSAEVYSTSNVRPPVSE